MPRIRKLGKLMMETFKLKPTIYQEFTADPRRTPRVIDLSASKKEITRQTKTALSKEKGHVTKFTGEYQFDKGRRRTIIYGEYKRTPERHIYIQDMKTEPTFKVTDSVLFNKMWSKPRGGMGVAHTKGMLQSIAKQFPDAKYIIIQPKTLGFRRTRKVQYQTRPSSPFRHRENKRLMTDASIEKENVFDVPRLLGRSKKSMKRGVVWLNQYGGMQSGRYDPRRTINSLQHGMHRYYRGD